MAIPAPQPHRGILSRSSLYYASSSEDSGSDESLYCDLYDSDDYGYPDCGAAAPRRVKQVYTEAEVRHVWSHNLEDEMVNVGEANRSHRYIAVKSLFPGIIARSYGEFRTSEEYRYHQVRVNVNLLKVIQIGFTFFDENGNRAKPISTWLFNFKFDRGQDAYVQEHIDSLIKSQLDFDKHKTDGLDPVHFAAELIGSGVVLRDNTFISFDGGYDIFHLMKILKNEDLAEDDDEEFDVMQSYLRRVFDVKVIVKKFTHIRGNLQTVADQLGLQDLGPGDTLSYDQDILQHTPGSLLTGLAFFAIKKLLPLAEEEFTMCIRPLVCIYGLCPSPHSRLIF